MEATSGFGPVNNQIKKSTSTARMEKPVNEKQENHWNCYRDCVSSQSLLHNCTNFKLSDAPARLMQWSDGAWVELSSEALSLGKSAFLERNPMVKVEIDGNEYMFDFFRMLQVDVCSGLQRSIAWIDVNGKCYFPKFFIDESVVVDDDDDGTPKVEIEINVDTNKCKRKREGKLESEEEDTADSCCNSGNGNSKRQRLVPAAWPNSRLITEGERSFAVVRDLFMTGMKKIDPGVQITSIHQFTRNGPTEKARWEVFCKQLEITKAACGESNTVFAWHGSSKKGVVDILAHGFGLASKVHKSGAHGVGAYLSPIRLPEQSNLLSEVDNNGERHVVLCRVILSKVEKVEAGSQQFCPSSMNFDTGVDDLVNPKWYVVWITNVNTHILPECVVSYKCSNTQQGEAKGSDYMNSIPYRSSSVVAKLFSKLRNSLPSTQVEKLTALCMAYKDGKMVKDLFIRELRTIVGNDMLRCAISEFQGSK